MLFGVVKCFRGKLRRLYYQFYNLHYFKFKGAKIGKDCKLYGKVIFNLNSEANIEIGDNFICRSGFRNHILGEELSSFHISGGGVKNWR